MIEGHLHATTLGDKKGQLLFTKSRWELWDNFTLLTLGTQVVVEGYIYAATSTSSVKKANCSSRWGL